MRLPRSKIYRAFPELDEYSDDQCRAYVKSASRTGRRSWGLFCVLAVIGWFGGFSVLFVGASSTAAWVKSRQHTGFLEFLSVVGALTAAVGVPTISVVMARDRWLRQAIARHLNTSLCPECRYQLLGLIPTGGAVRCPECGLEHSLAALGFSEQQWEQMLVGQELAPKFVSAATDPRPSPI